MGRKRKPYTPVPGQPENPLGVYMESRGISREQLARELGLSTPFVINVINGKNCNISVTRLKAIHDLTGIPYDDLVDYFYTQTIKGAG